MSTSRPKWWRKSAPSRGLLTSAIIKIQRKVLRKPRLRVNERVPYVAIGVPLTAESVKPSCLRRRSERVGGSTLTCAPVSTRKESLLERSVMCNRRHVSRPDVSVAANGWPARFARLTVFHSGKVECISLRYHQTFGDTSNWDCLEGLGWVDDFGNESGLEVGE